MGEYAEMMLDGTCCSCCGEYLSGIEGFPQMCEGCAEDAKAAGFEVEATGAGTFQNVTPVAQPKDKVACPECGKQVKGVGMRDHMRAKHDG